MENKGFQKGEISVLFLFACLKDNLI